MDDDKEATHPGVSTEKLAEQKSEPTTSEPATIEQTPIPQDIQLEAIVKKLEKGGYKVTQEYDAEKLSKISGESQRHTPWDWSQLLLVPVILLALGSVFTAVQNWTSNQASAQQHLTDIQIAEDQQQNAILQAYLDKMSNLIISDHLKDPKLGSDARNIAQAETLTVLLGLNNTIPNENLAPTQTTVPDQKSQAPKNQIRKGMVVEFLYTDGLINGQQPILNLNTADLSQAWLENVNFPGINLSGANLSSADLSGANLNNADLSYADLSGADLRDTTLKNATLSRADLNSTKLSHANLSGANASKAILSHADLSEDNLTYTDFTGAQLDSAYLQYAVLIRAQLPLADLFGSILTSANLISANLSDANLGLATLDYAVLRNATLLYADLDHAVLTQADFSNAKMSHVDLNHAHLTNARLNGANLDWADVTGSGITQQQENETASHQHLAQN